MRLVNDRHLLLGDYATFSAAEHHRRRIMAIFKSRVRCREVIRTATRKSAHSRPLWPELRGNSRARTKCRYPGGSAAQPQEATRSSAPQGRATHVHAQTERRRPRLYVIER